MSRSKPIHSNFENFHIPRYNELPTMELYSDQLITYLLEHLHPIQIDKKDPLITTSMVNSYVKCGLIPPTNKKRYTKRHIAYLIVICVFKQIYSIPKIVQMINIQTQLFETEIAYDYFCTELENALQNVNSHSIKMSKDTTVSGKEERLFVRASVYAFALKFMVESYLESTNGLTKQIIEDHSL